MIFEWLADSANWLLPVIAAITLLITGGKKFFSRTKERVGKINAVLDTLGGRDEIVHPETGEVLAEAQPALGARLGHIETALVRVADTSEAVASLGHRVDLLGHALNEHVRNSEENSVATRRESEAMWKAIEAVANATPPPSE